jgi:nitronate monooxygenase
MNARPTIIQGGMGVGISSWPLARAVSMLGQLGVVSGTALDQILARRLQDGDPGGHLRRALDAFPSPSMAGRILREYCVPGGKTPAQPYRPLPMHAKDDPIELVELCIVGNFVEVFLAREGHQQPVGINYLEKIQIPHLPSIYGAMLAGVDYELMGAGIPVRIPGVLDRLANHEPATYPMQVTGATDADDTTLSFDPHAFMACNLPPLKRPQFLAIIASNALAATLLKRANGVIDGFIVEGPTAGGHNAPPRGRQPLNEAGEPVYGERDVVDLERLRALRKPFWLAGAYGDADKLREAIAAGASGVQVGTAFAFCRQSGLRDDYKTALLEKVVSGEAQVFTDPLASPTALPFKVARIEGTSSEAAVYEVRARVCDLGYIREAYRTMAGTIGYRCPAEPVGAYLSKGGRVEETVGRKCICNALVANIGLGQIRGRACEPGLVTAGNDLCGIARFFPPDTTAYDAADVIVRLLA